MHRAGQNSKQPTTMDTCVTIKKPLANSLNKRYQFFFLNKMFFPHLENGRYRNLKKTPRKFTQFPNTLKSKPWMVGED